MGSGCTVRLGNLIYWMGCAGAVVFAGIGLGTLIFGSGSERFGSAVLFGAGAGMSWLAGRAARFLATRK